MCQKRGRVCFIYYVWWRFFGSWKGDGWIVRDDGIDQEYSVIQCQYLFIFVWFSNGEWVIKMIDVYYSEKVVMSVFVLGFGMVIGV